MSPGRGVHGRYLRSLERAELSVCDSAVSFLQSGFWGSFKAKFGWEARAFTADWGSPLVKPLLVLCRRLTAGFFGAGSFSLAYVPWGPELPEGLSFADASPALEELALALKETLPSDTAFIRFDPPWYTEGPGTPRRELSPPFIRSGADIQAPDTVLVNLKEPMETVLEGMKPKWRYNGRLALKKGVAVRRAGREELEVFYGLLKETARRDGIAIHGLEYYGTLLESGRVSGETPGGVSGADVRLYLAEHEGDVLAGIMTLFRGGEAVYLYGASSNLKRNLMAPYALQMKAMEDAKASGCGEYDLFGIPPDEDPSHPMAGLYRFKTGFGGRIIHRPGSWDYPCRPFMYRLFRAAEEARKKIRTEKKRSRRAE